MGEGCAHEHVANFEFYIAIRQPNHPLRPSDSCYMGFNGPEDSTAKVNWTFESDDGLFEPTAKVPCTFACNDGLFSNQCTD